MIFQIFFLCFEYCLAICFWKISNIIYFGYFYILNQKVINIFKYIHIFRVHSGIQNTLVGIGYGFSSLDTIFNPFGYLTNFDSVQLIRMGLVRFFRLEFLPNLNKNSQTETKFKNKQTVSISWMEKP